jgi:hypothetical protein
VATPEQQRNWFRRASQLVWDGLRYLWNLRNTPPEWERPHPYRPLQQHRPERRPVQDRWEPAEQRRRAPGQEVEPRPEGGPPRPTEKLRQHDLRYDAINDEWLGTEAQFNSDIAKEWLTDEQRAERKQELRRRRAREDAMRDGGPDARVPLDWHPPASEPRPAQAPRAGADQHDAIDDEWLGTEAQFDSDIAKEWLTPQQRQQRKQELRRRRGSEQAAGNEALSESGPMSFADAGEIARRFRSFAAGPGRALARRDLLRGYLEELATYQSVTPESGAHLLRQQVTKYLDDVGKSHGEHGLLTSKINLNGQMGVLADVVAAHRHATDAIRTVGGWEGHARLSEFEAGLDQTR